MMRRLLASLAIVAAFASSAFAQQAQTIVTGTPEPPLPKPLAMQRDAGAQPYYLGRFETLDGWVMVREGQPEFYYATTDGKAVLMGFLFDANGTLLTGDQMKAINTAQKEGIKGIVSPVPATAEQPPQAGQPAAQVPAVAAQEPLQKGGAGELLMTELQAAASMTYGDGTKPTFHAFIDPNCEHCRKFLSEMAPLADAGKLAIRIIPVAYNDRSTQQGAYALALSDGAKRFVELAKGNDKALEPPQGIMTQTVDNNRMIMKNWKFDATPIIVYRAAGTGEVRIIRGRPIDPAAVVKDLTGQ